MSSEEVMRHMAQRLAWVDSGLHLEVFTDAELQARNCVLQIRMMKISD